MASTQANSSVQGDAWQKLVTLNPPNEVRFETYDNLRSSVVTMDGVGKAVARI
jgi:hypothetical protein